MSEAKVKRAETKESSQQQDSTQTAPEPNIRLSAERGKDEAAWQGSVTIGNSDPIALPEEAVQIEGWYEPRAMELVRLSGGLYKMITKKGVR
jgi:hypothetical protein